MKKLVISKSNTELRALIEKEKNRIFKEVKKHGEIILEINKNLFHAIFKKRFTFRKDTVLLYRIIENNKDNFVTELFASYRILKDRIL